VPCTLKSTNPFASVLYYETLASEQEAVQREQYIKSGTGREWLKEKIKENHHG
jgi:predicted GIY-YIG superfamily endonuclease